MRVTVLGIIPARAGSKRVHQKNIKLLSGKPLISYTFEQAKKAKLIDKLIVSTNDSLVIDLAKQAGIDVPFIRPDELCTDKSSDYDVIQHALEFFKKQGQVFTSVVYLRPTSPFKTSELIDECLCQFQNSDKTALRTVTAAAGVFHPYWMYKAENNELKSFIEGIKLSDYYQSQLLPKCLRLNGVVDILKASNINQTRDIYGDKIGYVELNEEQSMDIDTERDFKLCEFFMSQKGK